MDVVPGSELATCSEDRTVKIWSTARPLSSKLSTWYITGLFRGVSQVLQEDSDIGRAASDGESAVKDYRCTATIQGVHSRAIYSVDWHPTQDLIATASADNCLRIFRRVRGRCGELSWELACVKHDAHSCDINCVSWKPKAESDGTHLLATAGDDCLIKIWKYTTSDFET